MCGIVGMFSKESFGFDSTDKSIFTQMIFANTLRGVDSTGVFGVNRHGNVEGCKSASSAPFFINTQTGAKMVGEKVFRDFQIVVGHNRKATIGQQTDENAHPFIEGNKILVHNGTLINHKALADTTVDSHAIVHSFNTIGYKKTLEEINGAYALVWYDADLKTAYITRNAERPLFLVETNSKIYFASEDKMLDWILSRNGIKKFEIQNIPVDKIFSFNLTTKKLEAENKQKKKEKVYPITTYQTKTQHHSKKYSKLYGGTSGELERYYLGESVLFRITDFDFKEHGGVAWEGEILDTHETVCSGYIDKKVSIEEAEDFINAKVLEGKISSIAFKNSLKVWINKITIPTNTKDNKNNIIDLDTFEAVGSSCFNCGQEIPVNNIKHSRISTDSIGNITNMFCWECYDSFQGAGLLC